eukprot:INCI6197.2.p1 GENE.INCI6197.2~~INCI6197.2.p1  ORF type:complete len:575 (-),score=86.10 INCI6197.2:1241-2965(-)
MSASSFRPPKPKGPPPQRRGKQRQRQQQQQQEEEEQGPRSTAQGVPGADTGANYEGEEDDDDESSLEDPSPYVGRLSFFNDANKPPKPPTGPKPAKPALGRSHGHSDASRRPPPPSSSARAPNVPSKSSDPLSRFADGTLTYGKGGGDSTDTATESDSTDDADLTTEVSGGQGCETLRPRESPYKRRFSFKSSRALAAAASRSERRRSCSLCGHQLLKYSILGAYGEHVHALKLVLPIVMCERCLRWILTSQRCLITMGVVALQADTRARTDHGQFYRALASTAVGTHGSLHSGGGDSAQSPLSTSSTVAAREAAFASTPSPVAAVVKPPPHRQSASTSTTSNNNSSKKGPPTAATAAAALAAADAALQAAALARRGAPRSTHDPFKPRRPRGPPPGQRSTPSQQSPAAAQRSVTCPRCSTYLNVPKGAESTGFRCGQCNACLLVTVQTAGGGKPSSTKKTSGSPPPPPPPDSDGGDTSSDDGGYGNFKFSAAASASGRGGNGERNAVGGSKSGSGGSGSSRSGRGSGKGGKKSRGGSRRSSGASPPQRGRGKGIPVVAGKKKPDSFWIKKNTM